MISQFRISSSAPSRGRIDWIDVARGIGIILVVYGHVLRGWRSANLIPSSDAVMLQDQLIYAFHMPLFFFLSGLVSTRGIERGRSSFLQGRLATIVYPYFLWSVLQGTASMVVGSEANNPATFGQLVRIAWEPYGQFWFLYALFLCQLTLLLPTRWALPLLTVGAIAIEANGRLGSVLDFGLSNLPYFAAGYWVGAARLDGVLREPRRAAAMALLGWGLFAAIFFHNRSVPEPPEFERFAMGFAGLLGTIAVARIVIAVRPLQALGAASMAIYLVHVIASAAARSAMRHFHLPVDMTIILGTVAGLLLPYLLLKVTQRIGIAWALGFEPRRRASVRDGGPLNLSSSGAI